MVSKSEMFQMTTDIVKTMIEHNVFERSNDDDNVNVAKAFETIFNKLNELNTEKSS